ncbi:MAG TPA: hypothetical protein VKU87_02660 [Thermomicrobiaceae bacterium]|nr:hypothetical protein [Thermomicrobiaceae bacterium]
MSVEQPAGDPPIERVVRTLEETKALIGTELTCGPWYQVPPELIEQFAAATDTRVEPGTDENGREALTVPPSFLLSAGGLIGAGRRGISIDLGGRMTVNLGLNRARFPRPVYTGQRIRLRSTLIDVEEIGDRAVQMTRRQEIDVADDDGEATGEPAMVAETVMRVYF